MTLKPDAHDVRQALALDNLGQVAPALVAVCDEGPKRLSVVFSCLPCEEYLVWAEDGDCWVCPRCRYQLDRPHGQDLLELAARAIAEWRGVLQGKNPGSEASVLAPVVARDEGRRARWTSFIKQIREFGRSRNS